MAGASAQSGDMKQWPCAVRQQIVVTHTTKPSVKTQRSEACYAQAPNFMLTYNSSSKPTDMKWKVPHMHTYTHEII